MRHAVQRGLGGVEEALAELFEDSRQRVLETIAAALVDPRSWPAPGGWDGVLRFGSRCWVAFTAYADRIEVYDVGCVD